MKIGLFFGSFNPIHHGHLIIANFLLQKTDLNQVWFVVSPQNPLKHSGTLLNEYQRLFLVQLAITGENSLKASDIEFRLPRPSYSIDTLTYVSEKYPEHNFSVIMGSDSYENLVRWKNYQMILKFYKLYVYLRPGHEIQTRYEGADVEILKAPLLEISATHLRETIRNGGSIRYLVPDSVKDEIERNGYYRR
jgi:nicotinate-nucleotide adenylyltransferase